MEIILSKVIKSDDVQSYSSIHGIKWYFIIELAPLFYERQVGLVKRNLRKTLGRKSLTSIQLQTLFKEIEAVVNSRPLVYVGEDINSSITITPRHFLSFNRDLSLPEIESEENTGDMDYNPHESSTSKLLKM